MALDIKPTRSELINLKRRIKQTKNGYKLLKMKRDGLFHEFRTLLSDMIKAKRELTESYVLAKSRIDLANLEAINRSATQNLTAEQQMQQEQV